MKDSTSKLIRKIYEDFKIFNNATHPEYIAMTEKLAEQGCYVYHVIDGQYILGGTDKVRMISYCYVSDEDNALDFIYDFEDGIAIAHVVNPTWGIEEKGSVSFRIRNGAMRRNG